MAQGPWTCEGETDWAEGEHRSPKGHSAYLSVYKSKMAAVLMFNKQLKPCQPFARWLVKLCSLYPTSHAVHLAEPTTRLHSCIRMTSHSFLSPSLYGFYMSFYEQKIFHIFFVTMLVVGFFCIELPLLQNNTLYFSLKG